MDLFRTIESTYRAMYVSTRGCERCYMRESSSVGKKKYMEIPISNDSFELPVFAIKNFVDLTVNNADLSTDVITAMLYTLDRKPRYKSIDRYMRDIILEKFTRDRLVKCEVKQGSETILYYGTHGAVFDKHFKPVMMCTWLMQRDWLNEETRKYKFVKPVFRIDPSCFINQADPMQRWITRKAAAMGLSQVLEPPYDYDLNEAFYTHTDDPGHNQLSNLVVEVCECPFKIITADVPSISTTNESLLQLAIDHIDEIAP